MKLAPQQACVLLICLMWVSMCNAASLAERYVAGPYDIVEADFVISKSELPPANADWIQVKLPHLWSFENITANNGWYRFKLPDKGFDTPQGAYLWRFSMNNAVWLNDEFLGDGGSFDEPIARNWNRPFIYMLPKSAWKPANNYLYVRLGAYPNWGNLTPVMVGPFDTLRAAYERRYFWQISMSEATFYISLITAIVAFALWAADQKSRMYAYFGLSCIAWSLYSLNLYLQDIPISAKAWWSLVHSSVDWYGVTIALFAHRLLGLDTRILDRLLIGFGVLSTATYWLIDLPTLSKLNSYFHFVTLSIAAYLFVLSMWHGIKERTLHVIAFSICSGIIVGFGLHDFSMNAMLVASLWQHQFFWLQFSAPILMITMLVILAYRFVLSFREQVNAEQQIRTERERIFSDIHDDVGSKVLSLVYSAESNSQAEMARDALREIRAIVAGGTSRGGALATILSSYEAEARQRFNEAAISLDWTENLQHSHNLSDSLQYHLQRIFRELVSNIIKHASTDRVEVFIHTEQGHINIMLRDFGVGMSDGSPGTGMSGVARRVAELNGTVNWADTQPGCRVDVHLPLNGKA